MQRSRGTWPAFVLSVLCAASAAAHDQWDLASVPQCVDDTHTTCNDLMTGVVQVHDLQGTAALPDEDWMVVETKARRSYELDLRANFPLIGPGCVGCPRVDRVHSTTSVLTAGIATDLPHPFSTTTVRQVVRWTGGTSDERNWIRVLGPTIQDLTANDRYEVVLRDTTLAVPRWNNSATQSTILLISNQSPRPVDGSMHFYSSVGNLLESIPFSIPRFGVIVAQTASSTALAGQSGSATVTHNAGYGELAGKAVALEPATGFTFDTTMTWVPY
jgi:hypothetical protein